MKRDLTELEKDFIENQLKEKNNVEIIEKEDYIEIIELKKPKFDTKNFFLFRPTFWVTIILIIPFIITAFIMTTIIRIESFLGADSLKWLSSNNMSDQIQQVSQESGISWLPMFLDIYPNIGIIIGVIFAVFIILAAIVLIINFLIKDKKNKKDEEKN